ncbi:MAG: NADH-quinone oxidoreductase subunit NuoG [Chloroflexi bacterium]|nr:NADH-quinone oxidoreductase subunit NuoG [Chloroflexota bacterium]
MPTIYIDHQPYIVREGINLLQALLELGFNLPYFCWHPAMGSVGACRQCAIKQFRDENDTRGRIVMACMTPANDNTYISVFDPEALQFRASVTEWMMINHPHDCPVCDEGGECHLQDMTIMTGHNYRRHRGKKRTFNNQELGPFINQEMNRCIQCYRCVRFYRDYAGGRDFNAFSLHDTVFFGRAFPGVLESEFSGNLVEVCPTGVFTDKQYKQKYARKWDLATTPSICVNCSVGCNTIPGERMGELRRIRNRYNGDVNGYFLCDRGRYGWEFVNGPRRIHSAGAAGGEPLTKEKTIERIQQAFSGSPRLMGIGSPRASLESNYALRVLVGPENFYQGIPDRERGLVAQIIDILQNGPARSPSLHDISTCDAVLLLGEDVSNTAPMMAFALRQAVRQQPVKRVSKELNIPPWDEYPIRQVIQDERGPLYIITPNATRIDDIATGVYHGAPEDIARLGFAVAHELDASAPDVPDLPDAVLSLAAAIAAALRGAERPLVLSGTSLGSPEVIQAAASVAWALCSMGRAAHLGYAFAECNTLGLGLIGGQGLEAAMEAARANPPSVLVVLENDLFRRGAPGEVGDLLKSAQTLVVLDSLETPTTAQAQLALPAAAFPEGNGSFVNHEGRVQRFYQVYAPAGETLESWKWIQVILQAAGRPEAENWSNVDSVQAALADALPVFRPLLEVAPPAGFRIAQARIPRQTARFSGRTAIYANRSVQEQPPPDDPDTPFSFSMEGARLQPPPALIPRFWAPGWNSIQSLNKFQAEINGPLVGGNPGRRLIEPPGAGTGTQPESDAVSGKPFETSPKVVGPGVEQPEQPLQTQPPVQPSSPQSVVPLPNPDHDVPQWPPAFMQPQAQEPAAQSSPNEQDQPSGQTPESGTGPTSQPPPAPASGPAPHPQYFRPVPAPFKPRVGEWLVVPLYHVFGSEELSVYTPGIASLTPTPYLAINPEDAAALRGGAIPAGQPEIVTLTVGGATYNLPVSLRSDLPPGVVGLPVLPDLVVSGLPEYGRLTLTGRGEAPGREDSDE